MVSVPCKGCKDRALGCHDQCKSYNTYKLKNESIKQKRIDELRILDYHIKKAISCSM